MDKLNKIEGYEYKRDREQNSRYLDNGSRRDIYKTWLNSEFREKNRQCYNACSKAIAICEAAARYPDASQEAERIKAAQEAAQQWEREQQLDREKINTDQQQPFSWARTSDNSYEVSSAGDSRFSALKAKFKAGTVIDGVKVGGKT